jgi:hypothetical protein
MSHGVHWATAECVLCGKLVSFDPGRVPALYGQPMCLDCTRWANAVRREEGQSELWNEDPTAYGPVEGLPE